MIEKRFLSESVKTKEFKAVFIAVFNSFSWYFPLYIFFANVLTGMELEYNFKVLVFVVHYTAIVAFAFLGNFLANKIDRHKLLSLWMLIGAIVSPLILFLPSGESQWMYLVSFSLGLSLGLGFPSCLAFFGDYTAVEHRGLLGGIIYVLTCIGMSSIGFLTSNITGFVTSVLIFSLWRTAGLIAFLRFKPKQDSQVKVADVSYKTIFRERTFVLYFIPWTMFCLINFFEIPFFDIPLQKYLLGTNLRFLISIGEFGIGGISALVGGLLSDVMGRKRVIISAYIMVGIGYAVLSFSSLVSISFYLYVVLDGISWGIFALMFYLIIWGDLAANRPKDKYYLIGILPFLLSSFTSVLVEPYAGAIPLFTSFSLASFFLFLAVLPLLYAPETLPERNIRERELKDYIEKAKKVKDKHF